MGPTILPILAGMRRGVRLAPAAVALILAAAGPLAHCVGVCDAMASPADSLYNAIHPRLLFDAGDLPFLQSKVRDGGYDDDAYTFIRLVVEYIYPGDDEIGILGDDYGLSSVPMLGLATHLEAPADENARMMGRDVTVYLADTYEVDNDDYASALRLRSLALGYDMFFANASETERQLVRDEIVSYIDTMTSSHHYDARLHRPYLSNRSAMVAAAVGLGAVVLADEADPAFVSGALDLADRLVSAWTDHLVDVEGAYNEGVAYAAWSLRHLVYYFVARKRYDGTDYARGKIRKIERWLAYELLPEGNGKVNNLNDSGYTEDPLPRHHTYLDWAEHEWGSGLAAYLYEHVAGPYGWDWGLKADKPATALWNANLPPVQPEATLPASVVWANRGLYYWRSGWPAGPSSNDLVFSFYSGKFQGGHAQEDQNQFTLYAYGAKFAIDHGMGDPGKQSESHNIVFVDGAGQHNAGSSIGTDGDISRYLLGEFADFVQGDATAAYATHSPFNNGGFPFIDSDWSWGYLGSNPVLVAMRSILAVHSTDGTPPYFLVFDDIDKDGTAHDYQWRLHTADANSVDTSAEETWIQAQSARMIVHHLNPPRAAMTAAVTGYNNLTSEPDSKLITFDVTAVNPRFAFLLFPGDASTAIPVITREEFPWGVLAVIDWGTVTDLVALNFSGGAIDFTAGGLSASVQTDAAALLLRFSGSDLLRYLAAQTQILVVDGTSWASIANGPTSVAWSGETVSIDRYDADFTLYGPAVTEIRHRAQQIYFVEDGGYLTPDPLVGVEASTPAKRRIRAVAYPNPFNPSTSVAFEIDRRSRVNAVVYDPSGRRVKRLADGPFEPGRHVLRWDGTNDDGRRVASGVYLVRLISNDGATTVKLTVVK
jgi:hypothetical protein